MNASSLIAAVHKRRPLWDPTDVHHHNRIVVSGLWRQIGNELGINMTLAKSKWRGLRDYYRQQLKRAIEQPESMNGLPWAHLEEMSFLGPSMAAGRFIKKEPSETEFEEMDLSETFEQKWSPTWSNQNELEANNDFEEDDLHFFKSLLPDLRGLPRAKKAYIRLQIQRVVFEEVYGGRKSPPQQEQTSEQCQPERALTPQIEYSTSLSSNLKHMDKITV